jgi:hypothetical protein
MGIGNPHGYPDFTWPMVWVLQDGELWPIDAWLSRKGQQVSFLGSGNCVTGNTAFLATRTVPVGRVFYVVGVAGAVDYHGATLCKTYLEIAGAIVGLIAGCSGATDILAAPFRATAGQLVRVGVTNITGADRNVAMMMWGYDEIL